MYILSYFKEYTCHSCILADRHVLVICNIKILNNIVKDTLGNLSVFACAACFDRTFLRLPEDVHLLRYRVFSMTSVSLLTSTSRILVSSLLSFGDIHREVTYPLFALYQRLPVPVIPYRYRELFFYILSILLALFVTSVFWKQ